MAWGRWKRGEAAAAPKPERVREGLRLSPNEERYVLAETLTGQVYAVPSGARFKGPLPFDKLTTALQETCDRHEARRTGYERGADGSFTKYVEARATIHLEQLAMPGASDAEIMAAVNGHTMRRGDLSPGELHRFILIELGPDDHVFAFALHHATSDGVSFQAFVMEVYARLLDFPLSEAPPQYSDFWDFDWVASEAYRNAEAFWRERLDGIGDPGAWPADRSRSHSDVRLGETVELDPDMVARTRAAAAAIGVTPFTYFYAVYLVLLSRMIGSETVVTTFQSAGRKGFAGAERTSGVFSNSLIVASRVDPAESVADIARRLRADVKSAIAHEIYPYHHAIRTTGVRARYAMNWMPAMGGVITFDDIQIIPMLLPQNQDDDDLNLRFGEYDGLFHLVLYYDPSAYDAPRVAAQARQLAALADALARDVDRPVGEVRSATLVPPEARPAPAEPAAGLGTARIFDAFLAQAAETPAATAISCGEAQHTYADVERRSRALARRLVDSGVGSGDRVAILAERGSALIWSMLAVARSGAAFVVLDSAYPEARLSDLMAIAAPCCVIRAGGDDLQGLAARLASDHGGRVLESDAAPAETGAEGLDLARSSDLAYLLFTSGSTGRPKGVAVSHAPLAQFVRWQADRFGLGVGDRVSLLSGLSHDPVLRDVFTPLSIGAAICVPPPDAAGAPGGLARWLDAARVSVAHLTPQMGRLVAAGAEIRLHHLREVFWGGDRLRRETVVAMAALAPDARQTSFYGSTETPQAVAACAVDATLAADFAPLGQGVDGAELLVVDRDGRPLGVGEPGEIAVRSNRLSLGYVENGRIVPWSARDLYRTGDVGLYLPDGGVVLTGRVDEQLKIRGHRVEPAEVADILRKRRGVRDVVVLPVGDGDDLGLVAFVSGRRDLAGLEREMTASVAARLPAYMVPKQVVWIEAMPLGPNGKVRREVLLDHLAARDAAPAPPEPVSDPTERALIEAWSPLLAGRVVTRSSTFAGLGGDSLSYVSAYLATEGVIGEMPGAWPHMTIAELAASRPVAAPQRWTQIDSPMLIRALAIVTVVLGHFQVLAYGGGATSALMLVSGFLFSLPLNEAFVQRQAAPILRTVRNIFLPTALVGLAIWLYRFPDPSPDPSILWFMADVVDYDRLASHRDMYLWYVHGLLHMLALVYLAVLGLKAAGLRVGLRTFLLGLFAVGCVGRFLAPALLDPQFFAWGHTPKAMIFFLPSSNLATLALGALIATAADRRERLQLAGVIVVYAGLTAWLYSPAHAVFVLVAGLVLTGLPRMSLPRPVNRAVLMIAGASLWIYLTHLLLREALHSVHVENPGLAGAALAMVGGVLFWTGWKRASAIIGRLTPRAAGPVDATV